ncbi:MAG: hypothetical protein ACOH2F_19225 [Cellulomonas sp.]
MRSNGPVTVSAARAEPFCAEMLGRSGRFQETAGIIAVLAPIGFDDLAVGQLEIFDDTRAK